MEIFESENHYLFSEASINSFTRYNNIFGSIQTRLGGNMSGNFHRGQWLHTEKMWHINVLEPSFHILTSGKCHQSIFEWTT